MSSVERELVIKLRHLYGEYERLNRAIRAANQRQRYLKEPEVIATAKEQEQKFLVEINRLMELASTDVVENRMRAEVAIGACG